MKISLGYPQVSGIFGFVSSLEKLGEVSFIVLLKTTKDEYLQHSNSWKSSIIWILDSHKELWIYHMNSSLSVPSSVRKSVTNFSQNLLFFPKILHSNRNLETEKVMEADFPGFSFDYPKIDKKGPKMTQNGVKVTRRNLIWKAFQCIVFLCKTHIWKSFNSQVLGQNAYVQSDCRIFWLWLSVEEIYQSSWFFYGDISQRKVACETTTFGWVCPGMPNQAKTCLDLPEVPLGSVRGILVKR